MKVPISLEVPSMKALDNSWEESRSILLRHHKKFKVFWEGRKSDPSLEVRTQYLTFKEVCENERDLNLKARIHQYDGRVLFLAICSIQGNKCF